MIRVQAKRAAPPPPVEKIVNKYSRLQPREAPKTDIGMMASKIDYQKFNLKVNTMMTDLNQTVAGEQDKNNKLSHTINQLKKALDMEKKRTMDLDQRLRDEFKEYKRNENEKIEIHEQMSVRLAEIRNQFGNSQNLDNSYVESRLLQIRFPSTFSFQPKLNQYC